MLASLMGSVHDLLRGGGAILSSPRTLTVHRALRKLVAQCLRPSL